MCDRHDRGVKITYTGMSGDGKLRECLDCSCEVPITPTANEVLHVKQNERIPGRSPIMNTIGEHRSLKQVALVGRTRIRSHQ